MHYLFAKNGQVTGKLWLFGKSAPLTYTVAGFPRTVAVRWLDFAAPVQVVRTKVFFSAPNDHHQIALVEAPKMHYLFAKNGQGMGNLWLFGKSAPLT